MAGENKSNEIRITRVYDASVQAVWEAWTDPAQVAQWWGPRGFTLTTHSKDLRVGGTWDYTMHGPDGTDYPNVTVYHEVVPMAKLVYDHGGSADRPPMFRVTVLFSESGGKTTMDMRMALATAEAAAETKKHIKKMGGNATWDRLAEQLAKTVEGKNAFVIARTFETSVERMFEMWTKPEHFSKWLPPTGFTMAFIRTEIREGGSSFYSMSNGGGVTMYGRVNYLEIRRPGRLVYTQQFVDEKENLSRHPMAAVWPETMLTTVSLEAEGEGQTRVRVVWEPYGAATAAEVAGFMEARGGMTQGWSGSFDKLEEVLGG